MEVLAEDLRPEQDHHPRVDRERDRRRSARPAARPTACCTCWRSRARPASRSTIDDFDRISEQHAAARRPEARRPLRRHRPLRGRRRRRWSPSGSPRPGVLHDDAITVTGRTIGEEADATPRRPPARRSSARSTIRSSRPAASRSCAATSPPRAAWSRSPGTERREPHGPGARVRVRGGVPSPPSTTQEIKPGDVVVIRNEGPSGGPGMREMLQRHRGARRRGARRGGRAAHRRPLLRRHPRPDGRPRRPRGGARRPDRRRRDGDEITFDVDARRLDVDLSDDEIAERVAAYEPPAPALHDAA